MFVPSESAGIEVFLSEDLRLIGFQVLACANLVSDHTMLNHDDSFKNSQSSVVFIGNVGSTFWHAFAASPEYSDGVDNPLDRYSERHIQKLALKVEGAKAIFPSDGPPYYPFQRWAMESGVYHQSPVAVLIHQDYGLWTAFRGALLLPYALEIKGSSASPCTSCENKPCLTSCPVGAFKPSEESEDFGSYDAEACRGLVATRGNCFQAGCLARRACPVNQTLSYDAEQVRFHMTKFISSKVRH